MKIRFGNTDDVACMENLGAAIWKGTDRIGRLPLGGKKNKGWSEADRSYYMLGSDRSTVPSLFV
jgi:hypothetical protein